MPTSADSSDRPDASPTTIAPRPLFIPRGLVLLSSLWVFVSWILLFGFHPPVQPQAASYGPPIQMLMMLIGVGIAVAWPLLRLSARPSAMPAAQAALDGLSIFVLVQVVVWPLRLVTNWTLARAISVDAAIAAAILLTTAILAASQGSASARTRACAMILSLTLVLLPAVGVALSESRDGGQGRGGIWATVLTAPSAPALIARCAQPSTVDPDPADRDLLFRAFSLASAAWAAAIGVHALRSRRVSGRSEPLDPND